jgi:hypothetical protein
LATGLHGAARTTPRVRAELQASQESTRALAARYGLNAKTVAKWRQRTSTADRPMGPSKLVIPDLRVAIHVSTPTTGPSNFHSCAPIGDLLSPTIYGCGCNVVSSERSVTSPLTDHRRAQFGARSRAGSLRPLLAGKNHPQA